MRLGLEEHHLPSSSTETSPPARKVNVPAPPGQNTELSAGQSEPPKGNNPEVKTVVSGGSGTTLETPPRGTFQGKNFGGAFTSFVQSPQGVGSTGLSDQGLEITKVRPGSGYIGLTSRCKVGGNFDVQVDYKLLNWPAQNFHTVRFAARNLPEGIGGHVGVSRSSYGDENYQFRSQSPIMQVAAFDKAGTLRLTRKDSTLFGYYSNGESFVLIGSAPTTDDPTAFLIDFSAPTEASTAPVGVAITLDNFKVISGTLICQ